MTPAARWMRTLVVITVTCVATAAAQQPRVAFVTSVDGTADLGSWPEAGSLTGAAAGDAICRNLAASAGLANPLGFVAWLSTSTDDAYCRLHGMTGSRASNCGQADLPVDAGPWVRPDGRPFAETVDRLLAPEGRVYYPPEVDETGAPVAAGTFSATTDEGRRQTSGTTCDDWTSATTPGGLWIGRSSAGTEDWTAYATTGCSGSLRLLCLERSQGPAIEPPEGSGALAFVTSTSGPGDLSSWPEAGGATGLAAGDAICRLRAAAAGLPVPDSFRAWLSDSTAGAASRIPFDGPWVRPDGVRIADSKTDLTDGKLLSALNVTESGAYLALGSAWTGTLSDGSADADTCLGWTSADPTDRGTAGRPTLTEPSWTDSVANGCIAELHLYCLSDTQLLPFADGFESGGTGAWSDVAGDAGPGAGHRTR